MKPVAHSMQVLGSMTTAPFLGRDFNVYFPIVLVIFAGGTRVAVCSCLRSDAVQPVHEDRGGVLLPALQDSGLRRRAARGPYRTRPRHRGTRYASLSLSLSLSLS